MNFQDHIIFMICLAEINHCSRAMLRDRFYPYLESGRQYVRPEARHRKMVDLVHVNHSEDLQQLPQRFAVPWVPLHLLDLLENATIGDSLTTYLVEKCPF